MLLARYGRLRSRRALNHVTSWTYNSYGQVLSATDARNHTTQFSYDSYGYQASITDALNHTTPASSSTFRSVIILWPLWVS